MLVLGTTASGQRRNMRKNGAVVKCVYLPDTGSMVENLDLGHEAGEEVAQVVAVPREHQDLGSLFLLGALRGKTRDGHGLEGSSAEILPSPRRAGEAQKLGVNRPFHWLSVCLVALCDARLVGCIAACSIRSSQAWSRSHQLDGKIRTRSSDDMASGNWERLGEGVSNLLLRITGMLCIMHASVRPFFPSSQPARECACPVHHFSINPSESLEHERKDGADERQNLVEVTNRRRDERHGRVDVQAGNEGEGELHDRGDDDGEQAERGLDLGKDDDEDVWGGLAAKTTKQTGRNLPSLRSDSTRVCSVDSTSVTMDLISTSRSDTISRSTSSREAALKTRATSLDTTSLRRISMCDLSSLMRLSRVSTSTSGTPTASTATVVSGVHSGG